MEAMYKEALNELLEKKLIAKTGSYRSGSRGSTTDSSNRVPIFIEVYMTTVERFKVGDSLSQEDSQ